jgi:hypothetical protein
MMIPRKSIPIIILISTILLPVGECFSPSDKITATAAARVGKPPPFEPSKRRTSVTSATISPDTSRHHHHSRISVVGKAPKAAMKKEGGYRRFMNQYEPCESVTQRKSISIEIDNEDAVAVQAIFCGYTASPEDFLRLRSAHV